MRAECSADCERDTLMQNACPKRSGRKLIQHGTISLLLFILGSVCSNAEESGRNYIGLSISGCDFHISDNHASPLIFSGTGIGPVVQYFSKGDESRQVAEGSYYFNSLSTANQNFHTDNWRGKIRYSYLYSIAGRDSTESAVQLFLGGSLGSFFSQSDYYANLANQFSVRSIVSWYWSHSLDAAALLEFESATDEYISLLLSVPLISNISRPQYSSSGDYNYDENDWDIKTFGETELFPNNLSANVLLMYRTLLSPDFSFHISYEFFYSYYKKPKTVGMYINNIRVGLFFCF